MLWAADASSPPLPALEQWWYFVDAADETTIKQLGAETAWDITSIGDVERTLDLSADFDSVSWLWISSDGTVMIVGGYNTSASPRWRKYALSTDWDVSTATYDSETYTPAHPGQAAWIDSSGTRVYVTVGSLSPDSSLIRQYSLSAAWDLSSASLVGTLDLISLLGYGHGSMGFTMSAAGEDFGFLATGELWDPGPPVVRTAHIQFGTASTAFDITTGLIYTDWYLCPTRASPAPLEGAYPVLAMPPAATSFVILVASDLQKYSGSIAWDASLSSYPDGTLPDVKDLSAVFPSGCVSFFAGPAV